MILAHILKGLGLILVAIPLLILTYYIFKFFNIIDPWFYCYVIGCIIYLIFGTIVVLNKDIY